MSVRRTRPLACLSAQQLVAHVECAVGALGSFVTGE
jgi:hypothetical protein